MRLGTLMAVPFDPVRLAVTGGPTGVIDGVMQAANKGSTYIANTLAGQFTVSDTGALVYLTGGTVAADDKFLVWVDRHGTLQPLPAPPRPYMVPDISPDGGRVAITTIDTRQVWTYDLARDALSAVTSDGNSDYGIFAPPDGKRIVFRSGTAEGNLYWKAADGSGAAEQLVTSARSLTPASWSPDGTTLAIVEEGDTEEKDAFQFDIVMLSIGDRKTRAVIRSAANEMTPEFSPDGRWLAYVSNESGRPEVYLRPLPGPGPRVQISIDGGLEPRWSPLGGDVFYRGSGKIMRARITGLPATPAVTRQALFDDIYVSTPVHAMYDVSPDGSKLVFAKPAGSDYRAIIVLNWLTELQKRLEATRR